MIEMEKKILLSRDQYEYLMSLLGCNKPITKQINYYFDTEDLSMNQQNITCRVRLKDGKYMGTVKRHTSSADCSTEVEVDVYNGIYNNTFTDMGLSFKGELVTERCIILRNFACEVVLDKNEYLGYTDFELEIEYAPAFEQQAIRVLNMIGECLGQNLSCNISNCDDSCTYPVLSKSKRFFEKLSLVERR